MAFDRFARRFAPTPPDQAPGAPYEDDVLSGARGYAELMQRFAGCTFAQGLYRLHDATTAPAAVAAIAEGFPEYADRAHPFGYDWLGRHFALDAARRQGGEPLVLLVEPGTADALEIPVAFAAFHDDELVEQHDAALASSFFGAWARGHAGELPLARDRCVGYRVPLFLGGADTPDNLELSDLDVYWSVCAQLRRRAGGMPAGTPVRDVQIGD